MQRWDPTAGSGYGCSYVRSEVGERKLTGSCGKQPEDAEAFAVGVERT